MPELNNTILKNSANLKAYYRLESGALTTDSSAGGYTLTNNNTVGDGTGKFGGCADFGTSNTDKSLSRADGLGIDLSATATINCWVKVRGEPATNASYTIADLRSTTGTSGRMIFRYVDAAGTKKLTLDRTGTAITYTVTLGTSVWHMVTAVYTASNHYIYLDGAMVVSGAAGNAAAGNSFNLGGMAGAFGNIYLDDVAVYDIALSADQVKELYEGRYIGELPKDTGCQGLWHFNGNITDFSSNNYHLTNTGTTDVAGKLGNARDFNGSSQYLTVAAANCNIATSQTWHSIIKADSLGDRCLHYIRNSAGGSSRGVTIVSGTNKLRADFDGLTGGSVSQSGTISTGVWYDVFAIYDSSASKVKIWVNGLKTEGSCSGTPATITGNVVIGRGGDRNEYYFDGIIDEVGMYNRAWSDKEVLSYYANARGKY